MHGFTNGTGNKVPVKLLFPGVPYPRLPESYRYEGRSVKMMKFPMMRPDLDAQRCPAYLQLLLPRTLQLSGRQTAQEAPTLH